MCTQLICAEHTAPQAVHCEFALHILVAISNIWDGTGFGCNNSFLATHAIGMFFYMVKKMATQK